MKIFNRLLFFPLLFLMMSCMAPKKQEVKVGVDPSWYPLQLKNREQMLTAFSTELLTQIADVEHIPFIKVTVSWDNLLLGLQKGEYELMLSSMPPYLFNQKQFEFSDLYLFLGPVLVAAKQSPIDKLKKLDGKIVGVITGSPDVILLADIPNVIIHEYGSIPQALNAIVQETIDAALIDVLSATAYCRDLYQDQLKIATPPLTEQGLRLIAPYGKATKTIEQFNKGLKDLKRSGEYDILLKKWDFHEK